MTAEAPSVAEGFSTKDFRSALGAFATGVTVVTTMGDDGRGYGMTVNAFSSVSLDPPLVLVCAMSGATGSDELEHNGRFAVNILAVDQEPVSRYFASRERPRGRDAFRDIAHRVGVGGSPLIDDTAAYLDCRLAERHSAGDHVIFIGEVLDLQVDDEREPLLFHGGGYCLLRQATA